MKHGRHACFRDWVAFFPPLTVEEEEYTALAEIEHGHQMAAKGLTATQAEFPAFSFFGPTLPKAPEAMGPADQATAVPTLAPEPSPPEPPMAAAALVLPPEAIPSAPVQSCKYVFHLFSGQRREGDFQFYYEELAQGFNVLVLSIDIHNDPVRGDLAQT